MKPESNRSEATKRRRMLDVHHAIDEAQSVSDLASIWGVTRQRASQWLGRHVDRATHNELVSNGLINGANKRRQFDLAARLELIGICRERGWSNEKIGFAIGVSAYAIWHLVQHNAPDGLAAAIEDMSDEREAA